MKEKVITDSNKLQIIMEYLENVQLKKNWKI